MPARIGLIANPAAAHDIRRLSGYGSIVYNQEKARILRRVLLGLQAVGVEEALAMPDHYGLALAAASASDVHVRVRVIEMECARDASDSTRAAQAMAREGCACIVTLGGDGTNRAVAMGSGATPLLAISTGTNNVIPRPIEGTIAGLAAGLFARGLVPDAIAVRASKRLEVVQDDAVVETALVDIAASSSVFLGARAVTDTTTLSALWLTQATPGSIGLAAIGAHLSPLSPLDDAALLLELAPPDTAEDAPQAATRVLAPIVPGLAQWVNVRAWRRLALGEAIGVAQRPGTLALDGERTLRLPADAPPTTIRA